MYYNSRVPSDELCLIQTYSGSLLDWTSSTVGIFRDTGVTVPWYEAGSWEVWESVNHGDDQSNHHNAGIHDIQLGAEVHMESVKENDKSLLKGLMLSLH